MQEGACERFSSRFWTGWLRVDENRGREINGKPLRSPGEVVMVTQTRNSDHVGGENGRENE